MKTAIFLMLAAISLTSAVPAAAQPNAAWYNAPGWSYPVVPMHWEAPPVWLPEVLYGNEPTTRWNAAGNNTGNAAIPAGTFTFMFLDGMFTDAVAWGEIPVGGSFGALNRGPVEVRGGRHVMSVMHDAFGLVAESNENDNAWGRQFVWTPHVFSTSEPLLVSQPPNPVGGWEHLGVAAAGPNCDGFGFSSQLQWVAVALTAVDPAADYDLSMYEVPFLWDDGFSVPIAASATGAGHLDFVLANNSQVGVVDYNVGVETYSGTGDYRVRKVSNWYANIGDSYPTTMSQDEFLRIWQLIILPGQTGPRLVAADAAPGAEFRLAVFDQALTVGGLLDAAMIEGSAADGTLRLLFDFAVPGSYALAVYRDPVDGNEPADFTLIVSDTAADLAPGLLATWHSPLVPRPAADGAPVAVPAPTGLTGWVPETYFNIAVTNHGPDPLGGATTFTYMDGLRGTPGNGFITAFPQPVGSGGYLIANNIGPRIVAGGRHVWTLEVDPNNAVLETSEANNLWGESYVWYGLSIDYGSQWSGQVAALETGGWETVTSGEFLVANCNGYRLPDAPTGWWRAVALAHDPGEDLDLALHAPASGPKDGYDSYLASSALAGDYTDFVIVNENAGVTGDIDLGVLRYAGATGEYSLYTKESTIVFDPLTNPIGPMLLTSGVMLSIYDIYLEPDNYTFRLENLSGAVDWGLQLQPADLPYQGRLDVVPGAVACENGPGQGEFFQVNITTPGWYGLVVYKSKVQDAPLNGSYRVWINAGTSPVPDTRLPVRTAIAGICPNPFNPTTDLHFDLATAGKVGLDIYDVQGVLVRTLLDVRMESGRHVVRWDGRDRRGRQVPSGVYMARLRASGVESLEKLVLLK